MQKLSSLIRPRLTLVISLLLLFCLNSVLGLEYLETGYTGVDQSETVYHAREIAAGKVPHLDFHLHHFSGYLLPFALIELITPITPKIYFCLNLLFNFASVVLVWVTFKNITSRRLAFLAATVTATVGWFPQWYGNSFNKQSFVTPFVYLFICLILIGLRTKRPAFLALAGIAVSICSILDQRLLLLHLAFFVVCLFAKSKLSWRTLLGIYSASLILPTIGFLALACCGALPNFFQQTLLFPLLYRNEAVTEPFINLVFTSTSQAFTREPLALCLSVIAFGVMFLKEHDRSIKVSILLCLFSLIPAVFTGGRAYSHYWVFIAPVIIIAIGLLPHYFYLISRTFGQVATLVVMLTIAASLGRPLKLYNESGSFFRQNMEVTIKLAAAEVAAGGASSKAALFVWGHVPQIYLYANKLTEFPNVSLVAISGDHLSTTCDIKSLADPVLLNSFEKFLAETPPDTVVVYTIKRRGLANWLAKNRTLTPTAPYVLAFDFAACPNSMFEKWLNKHYELRKSFETDFDKALLYDRQT